MKIIKSTHRHKLNAFYAIIIDYNQSQKDVIEFNNTRRALIRTLGPKINYTDAINEDGNDYVRNPRWYWEENTRYQRRRIYLQSQKELTWLELAR
jgi:hypothetical protein